MASDVDNPAPLSGSAIRRSRLGVGFLPSLAVFASDIKLAHSIFAMPFAASAFVLAALPLPSARQCLLLVVAMVTARSFAMGMNRYLDRRVDAANPRTRGRRIPSGDLRATHGLAWSLLAAAVFTVVAWELSPLAGFCAPPLLVVLMLYSYMKRWTILTHWYLGFCLGLAPVAVEVALRGQISLPTALLGLAVALWTAGFDVLYALQDLTFDQETGLKSIPSRFGPRRSLWISRACFAAMVVLLGLAGVASDRSVVYYLGVVAVAALLTWEHVLVRDARDTGVSRHLNVAFFNLNAYVSVVFCAFAVLDGRWRH